MKFKNHYRVTLLIPLLPFPVDIMDQEAAERQLAKTENLLNRTSNKLANTSEEKREWFQTPKQRLDEKTRLAISEEALNNGKPGKPGQKRKGGKNGGQDSKRKKPELTPEEQAEERVKRELQKVAQVQAKFSKAKSRVSKLRAVDDEMDKPKRGQDGPGKKAGKKDRVQRSNFDKDLTDVSQKGAQKFRYQATKAKNDFARNKANGRPTGGSGGGGFNKTKTSSVKISNKAGQNKFNKGKNFGAPKQSKKAGRK